MSTFRVLDQLESVIRRSLRIPLTGYVMIDGDRLLSILEKLRASLPEELKQARYLTQENQRILREAHEKGEAIVADAILQAEQKMLEHEIMRGAQEHADELTIRATQGAKEMRDGVESYARDVLSGLETELERLATIVRNGKAKLDKESQPHPTPFFNQIAS